MDDNVDKNINNNNGGAKVNSKLKKRKMSVSSKTRATRKSLVNHEQLILTTNADEEEQGIRARKLDGAFFEEYSDIDDRHVSLVEEARQDSLKHESKHNIGPDPYQRAIFKPPKKEKALLLYKELVYTVNYVFGKKKCTATSLTDGQLYAYGKEVLKITNDEHAKILDEVKDMKPPECYLNVYVIAGSDLDPKDANGLSDPYCMMAVIQQNEGDKVKDNGNRVKKKVLRNFKTEEDVKLSKIKMSTLNPEWREKFKFYVKDLQNEVFRLDLWDKDDNSVMLDSDNTITAIKGFRGTKRFFKEIYQSATSGKDSLDDFMGMIEIPLKSVSTDGMKAWFELEGQSSKKKVGGKINMKLTYSAKDPSKVSSNISSASPQEVFKDLLNYFVRHDCEHALEVEPNIEWDCNLSDEAQHILSVYTIQHEIGNADENIMKWEVYSSLIHDTLIPIDYLNTLLDDYRDYALLDDDCHSEKEKEIFILSLDVFVKYAMELLLKYRYVFSPARKARCLLLGKYLMCLLVIYKLPVYKTKYPNKRLNNDIEEILKKSTHEWLFLMEAYHHPIEDSPLTDLQRLVNVANTVNADLKTGQDNYKPIFDLIKLPYMSVVFNRVENLLSNMLENDTKHLEQKLRLGTLDDQEMGTTMFELYLAVRDLRALKETLPKEDIVSGGVDDYWKWFQKGVVKWLDIARAKAEQRIQKALEIDEVRVIDAMVKHSTSAVDVTCLLGQICNFWKKLDWPDVSSGYMFLTQITEIVGKCAMDYATKIFNQLKSKGFYDDVGQFDVTDQLCIQMNNMAHVLQFLEYVPTVLDYDGALQKMMEIHGEEQTDKLRATLERILECNIADIHRQLDQIIDHIDQRMKESTTDYLIKIISFLDRDVNKLCDPLLDYIDSNLITLNEALLTQVFDRILVKFWEMFINCLQHLLIKNEKKLHQPHYERFADVLEIVRGFFHGDGNGLAASVLLNEHYMGVTKVIHLNKLKSEQLIEKFYMERCEEQEELEASKLGVLTFKAFYSNQRLNVYVMNCKNLLPMDTTGYSDPYVTLELVPKHLFPKLKPVKTRVEKNTLFPLFDESFSFEFPSDYCNKDGATLLFTVFDQDRITDDDIAGEVWYDLQNVPGLGVALTQGGFATAPQIEMCLMIGEFKGDTVKVLTKRKNVDSLADGFVQKQKQRIQKMADDLKKSMEIGAHK